jgi:hypothetical protein
VHVRAEAGKHLEQGAVTADYAADWHRNRPAVQPEALRLNSSVLLLSGQCCR